MIDVIAEGKIDCCHFLGWLSTGPCLYCPPLSDPSAAAAGVKIYSLANQCSFPRVLLFIYFCMLYMLIIIEKTQCQMILGKRNRPRDIFLFFIQHLSLSRAPLVHFAKDFYSPAEVYSSVTILFIGVASFQFATNGKSSRWWVRTTLFMNRATVWGG